VRAIELTSNQELAEEGYRQKHCVFGYTDMCAGGISAIFSLRWRREHETDREIGRLTVEVRLRDRSVAQVRGKTNCLATKDEMLIVRQWAGELGFTIR
jgi:hypothetical protein